MKTQRLDKKITPAMAAFGLTGNEVVEESISGSIGSINKEPVQPAPVKQDVGIAHRVVTNSAPLAQMDSRYVEIGSILPSGLSFYKNFQSLSIRPFSVPEILKLHRAVQESSLRHEVDAVSACLDQSAYDLTLGDFEFLMYWLRMNSYKKYPIHITFTCEHPDHLQDVAEGKATKETLVQVVEITNSNLTEIKIDFEACNEFLINFYEQYKLYLHPLRVADLVEGLEDESMDSDKDRWGHYAGMLNPLQHGYSLTERIEFLKKHVETLDSVDVLAALEEWADLSKHGIEENVHATCPYCRNQVEKPFRVDPMAFLPMLVGKKIKL